MLLSPFAYFTYWCLGTLTLGWISRRSLCNPRCHGFFRFFGFSTSAAVVLPNLAYWHTDIFAVHQLLSWFLLFVALGFLVSALHLLITLGGRRQVGAAENFAFENTAQLVETGLFRYVRHPMYSALMLFTWGVWLKDMTDLGFILAAATSLLLWLAARTEETENAAFFGDDYLAYAERTRRFIPYLF